MSSNSKDLPKPTQPIPNNPELNALLIKFIIQALSAGLAASIAEACTIPIDTAKVRLQIQGQSGKKVDKKLYSGMINTMIRISTEESFITLYKGLSAGIMRQLLFASTRIGLYEPVRNFYAQKLSKGNDVNKTSFSVKICAGLTTGGIGICIAQPADIIKIRFQAEGRLPEGQKPRYKNLRDAIIKIPQQDGIIGLWKGLGPNILRNSVINAAELATYDQIKQILLSSKIFQDNVYCHLTSAFCAGFCATVVGSPFDVVKTRIMNKPTTPDGKLLYTSAPQAFVKIFRQEGFKAFYKGFVPNFMRIGTWNIVMFLSYERIQKIVRYCRENQK